MYQEQYSSAAKHHTTKKPFTLGSVALEASDHNYHLANITPSVNFIVDILSEVSKSFHW